MNLKLFANFCSINDLLNDQINHLLETNSNPIGDKNCGRILLPVSIISPRSCSIFRGR